MIKTHVNSSYISAVMYIRNLNTYSRIHKDEVHLHKGEDHLQYWVNAL